MTGDGDRDKRWETRDRRQETRERNERWEMIGGRLSRRVTRQETRDSRQETRSGDVRRFKGVKK